VARVEHLHFGPYDIDDASPSWKGTTWVIKMQCWEKGLHGRSILCAVSCLVDRLSSVSASSRVLGFSVAC
jgi:hypothetical protein